MTEPFHVPQTRHIMRELLPPWLKRPMGDSLCAEGLFTVYDLDSQYMRDVLLARWPSYAPEDALSLIARDRKVPIGPRETSAVLRVRLRLWIDFLQLQGLPLGILLALQAVLAPDYPKIRLVRTAGPTSNDKALWYTLDAGAVGRLLNLDGFTPLPKAAYEDGASWDGSIPPPYERLRAAGLFHRHVQSPENWDVDGLVRPWRWWAIIYTSGTVLDNPIEWDGGEDWDGGGLWDGFSLDDTAPLLAEAQRLTPGKSRCAGIILTSDPTSFDPTATAVTDPTGWTSLPVGNWASTIDPTTGNPTRPPYATFVYWDL